MDHFGDGYRIEAHAYAVIRAGGEGLVAKCPNSPYERRRSSAWLRSRDEPMSEAEKIKLRKHLQALSGSVDKNSPLRELLLLLEVGAHLSSKTPVPTSLFFRAGRILIAKWGRAGTRMLIRALQENEDSKFHLIIKTNRVRNRRGLAIERQPERDIADWIFGTHVCQQVAAGTKISAAISLAASKFGKGDKTAQAIWLRFREMEAPWSLVVLSGDHDPRMVLPPNKRGRPKLPKTEPES